MNIYYAGFSGPVETKIQFHREKLEARNVATYISGYLVVSIRLFLYVCVGVLVCVVRVRACVCVRVGTM
jgi:hypothetical protein